ncbi:hypothetical protein AUJ46_06360 [Candidatus Peregrinibacteria bacterium CG1_02_54_53]|nr:MAG: hypothetical protein AUJ46_06360 [Candidatus Peregrinibacteria bacterium CG1_02_54_53]
MLAGDEGILLGYIFRSIKYSFQTQIEQILQLLLNLSLLRFKMLNRCPIACLVLCLLRIKSPEHFLCPVIGKRDLFDNSPYLLKQRLLPHILLLLALPSLLGAAVVVMAFLSLRSDGTTTRATVRKTDEGILMLSLVLFLRPPRHHPLHLVEQVFPDDWLEASRVELALHSHHPVVDGVL